MEDGYSMRSRTTARSRRSSMSRNSQLIKKNTGPHELRPSDLLIDRFVAWKHITKNLIAYFEGIADIESNTAKELTKLGGVIQVPFRQGNQFLGEGGMQDIFYGIRDKTRLIADHHANLSRTIESSIVLHLQKLRTEIKAHIKNIQLDTGKLANSVAKERELSTKVITDLARSITLLKNTPMQVTAKEDPWYCAGVVMRQLQKQVQEENALQKSIIIMQQNSEHFEEGVVRAIQTAWQTFDEWSNRMSVQVSQTWQDMGIMMRSIGPTTEWVAFASRTDHLLDPDTPLRNPETIEFPGKNDPSCIPVHNGLLERKKRFTRNYKEGYYVLTAAGYLHEHSSSDLTRHGQPVLSLFLPECILGAPSSQHAKSHKFHVEGKHSASGALAGLMPKKGSTLLGGSEHAYSFRFRSHDEMMEWWNDMKQLSKVYLTSSDVMDRSGPVPAAVRAAGYISEDEDDEEEEDGSSVEEEEDDDEEEEEEPVHRSQDHHHHHHRTQQPAHIRDDIPDYAPPATNSGIAIGKNGYAVEKKGEGSGGLGRKSSRREEKQPETQPPASQAAVPGAGLPAREGETHVQPDVADVKEQDKVHELPGGLAPDPEVETTEDEAGPSGNNESRPASFEEQRTSLESEKATKPYHVEEPAPASETTASGDGDEKQPKGMMGKFKEMLT